jgi:hypothetical protein
MVLNDIFCFKQYLNEIFGLKQDKVMKFHLELFRSGNLAHVEWRKSSPNGAIHERKG